MFPELQFTVYGFPFSERTVGKCERFLRNPKIGTIKETDLWLRVIEILPSFAGTEFPLLFMCKSLFWKKLLSH